MPGSRRALAVHDSAWWRSPAHVVVGPVRVLAFMSHVCFNPDMPAEIFILEPEGEDRAPEADPEPN